MDSTGPGLVRRLTTKRIAVLLIAALLAGFAVRNLILISRDLVLGDGSAEHLIPKPAYVPTRLPSTELTRARDAKGRLGADFAPIYFPAQDVSRLPDAYSSEAPLDPWHRPSRTAPMIILLCAGTVCRLPFGWAGLAHLLSQLLVFSLALYAAGRTWGLDCYVLPSLASALTYVFLTPVGLSWFERGQFSLYIAASHILLMLGLFERRWLAVALAAALAFTKWTSFPISAVILTVYVLSWRSPGGWLGRGLLAALFAAVIGLLLLAPMPFVRGTVGFLEGLQEQELQGHVAGLSLMALWPALVVKLLPLALVVVGLINLLANGGNLIRLIPLFIGAAAILLLYPTRAFNYSLPTLLGFIPAALLWSQRSGVRSRDAILVLSGFAAFLVFAAWSVRILQSTTITAWIYAAFSIIFAALPLILAPRRESASASSLAA